MGKVNKFIVLLSMLLLFGILNSTPSLSAQVASCNTTAFGPYCLNPHINPMPGYLPIDTVISFKRPSVSIYEIEHTDIGVITGYFWDLPTHSYVYLVVTNPIDPGSAYPFMGRDTVNRSEVINAIN